MMTEAPAFPEWNYLRTTCMGRLGSARRSMHCDRSAADQIKRPLAFILIVALKVDLAFV
jgi:hypothetical protein